MAAGAVKFSYDLMSKGYRRLPSAALALLFLPAVALSSGQAPASRTSLPPNAPVIPATIRNAPFSALVVTQFDREVPSGNRIHRETRGKLFRDAQGRVRTETQTPAASRGDSSQRVAIQDPVLRQVIHLDAKTKTANVHHLGEAQPEPSTNASGMATTKTGSVILTSPQAGTAPALPFQRNEIVKPPTVEPLGTKTIEGLTVTGTRTTRVITPAGGEPIVSVTEVWYSHDLQMVILSVSDDGESGHSVMRVTNIVRGSPSEQLFQVPPDYTVKDGNPIAAIVKH
jgi:hypothetical protein